MEKNSLKKALAVFALIAAIAVVGLVAISRSGLFADKDLAADISGGGNAVAAALEPVAGVSTRKERAASDPLEYRSEGGDPVVKVALDEVALVDADGKSIIVKLDPPATAGTLGVRMKDFSAPQGVMPVAYVEDKEKTEVNRRYVTSEIRAKMPQEQAEQIARKHGLRITFRPPYAPEWVVFSAEQPLEALEKIAGLRGEKSVESADVLLASYMSKKALPSDPLVGTQWHIKKTGGSAVGTDVNIETTWGYGTAAGDERRGEGIVVGIVDDGMQTAHPDLAPNVNTGIGIDYNGNDTDPNPGPGDNHGTACAGLVAAKGNNGIGVAGTAPAATLVGMRLIAGPVTDLKASQAMTHQNGVIFVKSNSWGPSDSGEGLDAPGPLTLAALANSAATGRNNKGTIFVWAGGNGGRSSTQDNSNYDGYANSIYTIAVGAMNSNGSRSDYSEPGANLVVVAPSSGAGGLGIVTTDNTGSAGYNTATSAGGGDYTNTFGGTSAATPEVSGIIALMLKENPNLGWRDVQEILIRTAKKVLPSDADWRDNSAGFHFNHDFGAGLIDATAAVTMSNPATWVNLGTQTSAVSTQSGLNVTIPNNNATGITRQFSIPTSNIRTEQATLRLSITHASRGELEISLTSPSGMVSRLAEVRSDPNANYSDWTFATTRSWGELSSGTWTLKIADRSNANNTAGRLTFAELKVFGASAAPVNPAPVVTITSPLTGSLSSPGVAIPVEVSAVDFDQNGVQSTVTKVELFANNVLLGTDMVPPYSFVHNNPPLGNITYVARATDIEAAFANSAPVTVTVVNQTPAITAVTQNSTGQLFSDAELKVTSVSANDPEGTPITLAYQWQSSTDESTYVNLGGATSAALPVSPSNAGKLWRCRITASDGNTTSAASFTAPVNILLRPGTFSKPGNAYSYQSGLVLKGFQTVISRQAIIHEFSHGNGGGNSQWVEILTMQTGSFRNWQFRDSTGRRILFRNSAVWDNIPAGTLIVIYDGNNAKNSLLPGDTTDASTGRIVVSSIETTHFDTATSTWPSFGSSGGSLFLFNAASATVHSLSYGSSTDASPNIGTVPAENAAFYFGDSDAGADNARNWLKTSSNTARFIPSEKDPETDGKSLNPLATFTGGRYDQNFNTAPGQSGTNYPTGWTSFGKLSSPITNFETMAVGNGSETTAGNFNYGSQIGMRGTTGTFEPGSLTLGLADSSGLTNLKISYDVVKIDEQPRSMDFILEYATSSPASSITPWTTIPGGAYSSGSSPKGTRIRFENIPLPAAIFNNRTTPVYLRWRYETAAGNTGAGARDALALDNVLISSAQSPNILLALSLAPSTVSEISGTAASLATVTVSEAPAADLTIQLTSSDTTSATVPATVVIPAGQTSTTFPIATINNTIPDGTRAVSISVAAAGYVTVSKILTVTDDEAPVNGVTPGKANSGPNELFITRLRTNNLNDPPLYSLGAGSNLPSGLSLNPNTGLISGTISPSAATGAYPVTVNLTNVVGDITSQTFTLSLTATGGPTFDAWIAGFTVADTGVTGDSDFDLLPNLVEYKLNSLPGTFEQPSPILMERTATEISITYPRAKNRDDVTLVAEWNTSLGTTGWLTTGITETILADLPESQTVKSSLAIAPGDAKRFIRLRAEKVVVSP